MAAALQKIDMDPELYPPKPRAAALHTQDRERLLRWRCMETSEALHWTQQQKIDMDPDLYTPKIEDIATAVIEMYVDI
ncbi:hypothetical protein LAZ67_3000072 [Cordylochernes scorpioides]|uniref:Uncharacterized protein n=1 Tax=Cordylochernes scorpioides TaxID=51811 RepID=A0ABY6K6T6_9ARAC|nr:hypothetical protein LAZ67_3000072 [Cordylochernes scorpioides]